MNKRKRTALATSGMAVLSCTALAGGLFLHREAAARQNLSVPAPQPNVSATSAPAYVLWDKSAKGIKLKYPADWQARNNPDYELMLLPPGASKDDRRITVDIPDLPPHLPFMIQMGRVEHDYVQDLKKDHPDLQVQDSAGASVPDSNAKLVRSLWHQNGTTYHDTVLLIIHASAVYILDAQSKESDLPPTRSAFDAIRGSIVWTKH